MSSSSAPNDAADVRAACGRLLQCDTLEIERFAGGRNSQIYRLDCTGREGLRRYVAKQYYSPPDDPRDRLGTEFRALQLVQNSVQYVLKP